MHAEGKAGGRGEEVGSLVHSISHVSFNLPEQMPFHLVFITLTFTHWITGELVTCRTYQNRGSEILGLVVVLREAQTP